MLLLLLLLLPCQTPRYRVSVAITGRFVELRRSQLTLLNLKLEIVEPRWFYFSQWPGTLDRHFLPWQQLVPVCNSMRAPRGLCKLEISRALTRRDRGWYFSNLNCCYYGVRALVARSVRRQVFNYKTFIVSAYIDGRVGGAVLAGDNRMCDIWRPPSQASEGERWWLWLYRFVLLLRNPISEWHVCENDAALAVGKR